MVNANHHINLLPKTIQALNSALIFMEAFIAALVGALIGITLCSGTIGHRLTARLSNSVRKACVTAVQAELDRSISGRAQRNAVEK